MPNFQYVGQAPETGDCGYYCGYVVHLMMTSGATPSRMDMTHEDVFRAREAHLSRTPPSLRPTRLSHSLGIFEVPRFLSSLHVEGYATQTVAGGAPLQTAAETIRAVVESVRRPNSHGIILPQGALAGHYIVILAGNEQRWLIYDPAGTSFGGGRVYFAMQQAAAIAPVIVRNHVTHFVRPAG
jgi:hypothetical protein